MRPSSCRSSSRASRSVLHRLPSMSCPEHCAFGFLRALRLRLLRARRSALLRPFELLEPLVELGDPLLHALEPAHALREVVDTVLQLRRRADDTGEVRILGRLADHLFTKGRQPFECALRHTAPSSLTHGLSLVFPEGRYGRGARASC